MELLIKKCVWHKIIITLPRERVASECGSETPRRRDVVLAGEAVVPHALVEDERLQLTTEQTMLQF